MIYQLYPVVLHIFGGIHAIIDKKTQRVCLVYLFFFLGKLCMILKNRLWKFSLFQNDYYQKMESKTLKLNENKYNHITPILVPLKIASMLQLILTHTVHMLNHSIKMLLNHQKHNIFLIHLQHIKNMKFHIFIFTTKLCKKITRYVWKKSTTVNMRMV